MRLSQFKAQLENSEQFSFQLPNGLLIPAHFHITEMGLMTKNFIDCGISIHSESKVTFQLWFASDFEHRLTSKNTLKIIEMSSKIIGNEDFEIEVEYQMQETIGKFGLDFANGNFQLTKKETACLAQDTCGFPVVKTKVNLKNLVETSQTCCSSDENCC